MKNKAGFVLGVLFAAQSLPMEALAQSGGHGAHEHGAGVFSVVLERGVLSVEIELPGADVVGFEHEANAHADIQAVRAALSTLGDASKVFGVSDAAACTVQSADVRTSLLHEDGGAEHKHEHDTGEPHGGFGAQYALKCEKPDRLTQITVNLFKLFPSLHEIDAVVVSDHRQIATTLFAGEPTISLVK